MPDPTVIEAGLRARGFREDALVGCGGGVAVGWAQGVGPGGGGSLGKRDVDGLEVDD